MNQIVPIPEVFIGVILVYCMFMLYLGWWAYKRTNSMKEFLVMGGTAGAIMSGMAYLTTQYSMSTFMGVPGAIYSAGWSGACITLTQSFTLFLPAVLVGARLRHLSRKLGFYTMTDYLANRYYSESLRFIVCIITVGLILPVMGAQTIGAGIIWNVFTGWPEWMGIVLMSVVVTFYCIYGGIRGAMVTDVAQSMLMIFTSVFLLAIVLHDGGGFSALNERLAAFDIGRMSFPGSPKPIHNYGWLFANLFLWTFFTMGFPQLSTKFFAMKNYETVVRSSIYTAVACGLMGLLIYMVGAFSPLFLGTDIPRQDFAIPLMAFHLLPGWLACIMMAGLLAAGMSTISSQLVVCAGSIIRDFYFNFVNKGATDKEQVRLIRGTTFALGIVSCLIGIFQPGAIFDIILFSFGGIGVMAIPLVLGIRWKRATKEAAIIATVLGQVYHIAAVKIPVLQMGTQPGVPALGITLILMVVVSLMTPPPPLSVLKDHYTL